jgi:hypothetical protein
MVIKVFCAMLKSVFVIATGKFDKEQQSSRDATSRTSWLFGTYICLASCLYVLGVPQKERVFHTLGGMVLYRPNVVVDRGLDPGTVRLPVVRDTRANRTVWLWCAREEANPDADPLGGRLATWQRC